VTDLETSTTTTETDEEGLNFLIPMTSPADYSAIGRESGESSGIYIGANSYIPLHLYESVSRKFIKTLTATVALGICIQTAYASFNAKCPKGLLQIGELVSDTQANITSREKSLSAHLISYQ
jgi:hypothetical protein